MMSEESDEALARRLQEQEFMASRNPGRTSSQQPNASPFTSSSSSAYSQPSAGSGSSESGRYQRLATDDSGPAE